VSLGIACWPYAQGAKLPAIERLVNTTYEKFPYYFPEPELGQVQFNMGIGRRQLPCCSLALTGLNGLPFLPALPSGASWQVFVNRKGFGGESNLIHPITLNKPAEGIPPGEFCLRKDIEKPGN
jgi:hypothetical protein